ncbi:MAG: hypothetical protein WAL56_01540, partial [Candidatus Sulfotelmatobacter sp.]
MKIKTYRTTILSFAVCFRFLARMRDNRRPTPLSAAPAQGLASACLLLLLATVFLTGPASAQDWVRTGSGLGVERVRLAVPDFKPANADPLNTSLLKTFNDTFWSDLDNS